MRFPTTPHQVPEDQIPSVPLLVISGHVPMSFVDAIDFPKDQVVPVKELGHHVSAFLRGAILRLHDAEAFESLNAGFNHHNAKPYAALRLLKTPSPQINSPENRPGITAHSRFFGLSFLAKTQCHKPNVAKITFFQILIENGRLSFSPPINLPAAPYAVVASNDLANWLEVTPLQTVLSAVGGRKPVVMSSLKSAAVTAGLTTDSSLYFRLQVRLVAIP